MPAPLVIAHRGASSEAPENTLPAFRRACQLGADGIELDVQLTADGVVVVFHDDTLTRLTGQRGRVNRHTWAELQKLRVLGSRARIPRLDEVLALTRRQLVVQIELKAGTPVEPVLVAVRRARAESWVILASFDASLVASAAALAPKIPRMLISEGRCAKAALVRQLATIQAHGLSVNHRAVRDPEFVTYFQRRGYSVWCWTVNDRARGQRLAGWGVDALLGDNPALLQRLI